MNMHTNAAYNAHSSHVDHSLVLGFGELFLTFLFLGLDIEKVSHVINYELPQHVEDYIHRIGERDCHFTYAYENSTCTQNTTHTYTQRTDTETHPHSHIRTQTQIRT